MVSEIYAFLSWLMVGTALSVILAATMHDRSLLLKPSFIVSVLFCLQVQIGSAILSDEIVGLLPNPWEFFAVIHGFLITMLVGSQLLFRARYRRLFAELSSAPIRKRHLLKRTYLLTGPALVIAAWYLFTVPFSQTGLFFVITQPDLADLMRESSFATLASPALKYGYYLMSFAIAPIIAVLLGLVLANRAAEPVRPHEAMIAIAMILIMMLLVSLYGARGPSSMLLLALLYAVFVSKGAPMDPVRLLLTVFLILLGPSMIVMVKNVDSFSFGSFFESFLNIVERVFIRGVKPNIWYFDYTQSHGFFGVAGIPKLAVLIGERPLDVANHISLLYDRHSLIAGTANSAFVTQYYSFFGIFGLFVSLAGVLLMDSICLFFRKWQPVDKLVALGALIVPFSALSFSQFTTVFLSKGILYIFLVVIVLRLATAGVRKR